MQRNWTSLKQTNGSDYVAKYTTSRPARALHINTDNKTYSLLMSINLPFKFVLKLILDLLGRAWNEIE